jgi:hypothetical protein
LNSFSNSQKSSFLNVVLRGLIPLGLCSAGSDTPRTLLSRYQTPQDIVLWGIRPRITSECYKMYTTLPLFCGVWYPARLSSVGSDTPQDFVLWGIRPAGKLRPCRTRQKSFESLPFSLKRHFSKIVCMSKLCTLPEAYSIPA